MDPEIILLSSLCSSKQVSKFYVPACSCKNIFASLHLAVQLIITAVRFTTAIPAK